MNNEQPAPPQPDRTDGSLRIRGRNILDMRLPDNDLQAATVREYLCEVLKVALVSGDHRGLAIPLVMSGMIDGQVTETGAVTGYDAQAATDLIWEAVEVLSAEPFRPIGIKTDTERSAARLQRRHSRGSR